MSGAGRKVNKNESGNTIHVTILHCKSTGQVIYLEAGKDFVDVLLSFLVLPVGTIIRMLNAQGIKERKVGAIDNIYKSVEKLQESMLYVNKTLLTEPRPTSAAFRGPGLLQLKAADQIDTPPTLSDMYYLCTHCKKYIGSEANFFCPCCDLGDPYHQNKIKMVVKFVASTAAQPVSLVSKPAKEGYVKKNVTYIVSNNLEILPTSSINSIDMLNKMKVQNLSDLLSVDQAVNRNDVLNILLASISGSKTTLNDVFGGKFN